MSSPSLKWCFRNFAIFTGVVSLLPVSLSRECGANSYLHYSEDNTERCCQNVSIPPGFEMVLCKEEFSKAEYRPCPLGTYQKSSLSSRLSRRCEPHSDCRLPNQITAVRGNSTFNNVCKCNEAEGYFAMVGTDGTQPYYCIITETRKSRTESSDIIYSTAGIPVADSYSSTVQPQAATDAGWMIPVAVVVTCFFIAIIIVFIMRARLKRRCFDTERVQEAALQTSSSMPDITRELNEEETHLSFAPHNQNGCNGNPLLVLSPQSQDELRDPLLRCHDAERAQEAAQQTSLLIPDSTTELDGEATQLDFAPHNQNGCNGNHLLTPSPQSQVELLDPLLSIVNLREDPRSSLCEDSLS